ncbi:MAG: proteasome assembly chaperone family protein [Candidatus Methanofastidiosia archaeon]|jgi:uncharacterized protein
MAEIIEKKETTLEGATAIEAFPGVGLVGHIAGSYIISALDMEMIGYITSENLPPLSIVYEGAVIPPLRIYTHENLVLFICDIPLPSEAVNEITTEIADFIEKKKVKQSLSLAGIGVGKQGEKVYAAATETKILDDLGMEPLKIGSIVGASGSLLLECKRRDIPGIGLLAETIGNVPDPRASAMLVETLADMMGFKIDIEPLLEEAEEVEERFQQMMENLRRKEEAEGKGEYVPMYR